MNILFHGCLMTMNQVAEILQAAAEGIRTFKMFMPYRGEEARVLGGIGSLNHAQMRIAFRSIAEHGGQALVHAEDGDIVDHCMQEELDAGLDSLAGWERSRPTEAEGDAAWTAMYLAEKAECPVTIVHVSSLEAIRARAALGNPDAALESCVHYMVLNTASDIGPEGKVAPPLRDPELAQALSDAVLNGAIDFFGSDHNVWPSAAKREWVTARPGLPGVGLMLPALPDALRLRARDEHGARGRAHVDERRQAVRPGGQGPGRDRCGRGPRRPRGRERQVRATELHSAVDYSPYEGTTLRAWPRTTSAVGSSSSTRAGSRTRTSAARSSTTAIAARSNARPFRRSTTCWGRPAPSSSDIDRKCECHPVQDSDHDGFYVGPGAAPLLADAVVAGGGRLVAPERASAMIWWGAGPEQFADLARPAMRWVQLPNAGVRPGPKPG